MEQLSCRQKGYENLVKNEVGVVTLKHHPHVQPYSMWQNSGLEVHESRQWLERWLSSSANQQDFLELVLTEIKTFVMYMYLTQADCWI